MPCTVTDRIGYRSSAGAHTAQANLSVIAVPSSTAQTYDYTGTWRPNAANNPLIVGSPALNHGQIATTNANGEFTLVLPYVTETHPLSPEAQWTILFPDGQMVKGVVPAAAGTMLPASPKRRACWATPICGVGTHPPGPPHWM